MYNCRYKNNSKKICTRRSYFIKRKFAFRQLSAEFYAVIFFNRNHKYKAAISGACI